MNYRNTNHTFMVCIWGEYANLEECIQSLMNQTVKTNITMVTASDAQDISELADKYELPLLVDSKAKKLGDLWSFAYENASTDYVSIVSPDDIYKKNYVEMFLAYTKDVQKPLIFFSDYAEIHKWRIITDSRLLKVKKLFLSPLKMKWAQTNRWIRRRSLAFGGSIDISTVAFCKKNIQNPVAVSKMEYCMEWEILEKVSKLKGTFVYCDKVLAYHRSDEETEAQKQKRSERCIQEYRKMYQKFWPKNLADFITKKILG